MTLLRHEFVDNAPEELEPDVLYVSILFATVLHGCACGCGQEVVTPLSPTGWILTYDGQSVSLSPSIGNWNLPCRSHYFIERNEVKWAHEFGAPLWRRSRLSRWIRSTARRVWGR